MAIVRSARPSDAAALGRIHVDSWQAAYLGIIPAALLNTLSVDEKAAAYRRSLSQENGGRARTLVVLSEGEIQGFAGVGPTRDIDDNAYFVGEIYTLYLAPTAWGRGLGFELFRAAQDHLAARLFSAATVWVLRDNTRARRFYEMAGFTRDRGARDARLGPVALPELRYRIGL